MPWKETATINQRLSFIGDYLSEEYSVSDLCRTYGINRTTAYKWIGRYEKWDLEGLKERSRAPHRQVHAVEKRVEDLLVKYRETHSSKRPEKILFR